ISQALTDMPDTELFQKTFHAGAPFLAGNWKSFENRHDIGFHGKLPEYGSLLRKVSDTILSPHVHGQFGNVVLTQHDGAIIRPGQADNDIKRRGFSGAVRSEEADHLSLADFDIHVTDHGAPSVGLGDALSPK